MPKQQLTAAAYHLKPSEMNKIILATDSFQDRCSDNLRKSLLNPS